jgi:hypothetical protein
MFFRKPSTEPGTIVSAQPGFELLRFCPEFSREQIVAWKISQAGLLLAAITPSTSSEVGPDRAVKYPDGRVYCFTRSCGFSREERWCDRVVHDRRRAAELQREAV